MRSIQSLSKYPRSLPILADDVLEFHAARLLLLLRLCGTNERIRGLTKMAKLDFFVRYPKFFEEASRALGYSLPATSSGRTESTMIRYHYGPWDQRYYRVLAFLESRGLIRVRKFGNTFEMSLTDLGSQYAKTLSEHAVYQDLCDQMRNVNDALGNKSGSELKSLVYELFDEEVAQLSLREVIE